MSEPTAPPTFASLRFQIEDAILLSKPELFPGETTGFQLIDGFANIRQSPDLSGNLDLNHPVAPMVMVVGHSTGRCYFFSLMKLLPNVKLS